LSGGSREITAQRRLTEAASGKLAAGSRQCRQAPTRIARPFPAAALLHRGIHAIRRKVGNLAESCRLRTVARPEPGTRRLTVPPPIIVSQFLISYVHPLLSRSIGYGEAPARPGLADNGSCKLRGFGMHRCRDRTSRPETNKGDENKPDIARPLIPAGYRRFNASQKVVADATPAGLVAGGGRPPPTPAPCNSGKCGPIRKPAVKIAGNPAKSRRYFCWRHYFRLIIPGKPPGILDSAT